MKIRLGFISNSSSSSFILSYKKDSIVNVKYLNVDVKIEKYFQFIFDYDDDDFKLHSFSNMSQVNEVCERANSDQEDFLHFEELAGEILDNNRDYIAFAFENGYSILIGYVDNKNQNIFYKFRNTSVEDIMIDHVEWEGNL